MMAMILESLRIDNLGIKLFFIVLNGYSLASVVVEIASSESVMALTDVCLYCYGFRYKS